MAHDDIPALIEPDASCPEFTLLRVGNSHGKLLRVPKGFMTGGMAREFLGITTHQFRSLVQQGLIESVKRRTARGWALYAEADVKAFAKNAPPVIDSQGRADRGRGEMLLPATVSSATVYSKAEAKQVFSLIRAGMNLVDVVLETDQHPATIMSIARDFAALEGCLMMNTKTMGTINALRLENEAPIKTADDMVHAFRTFVVEQVCSTKGCARPRSRHCPGCLQKRMVAAAAKKARVPESPLAEAG